MERWCANLLLAVALVSGALVAQTTEEIAAAITRLEGERLDAQAMEFLIDAGRPAVGQLLAVLAHENPNDVRLGRVLRVLRAMGPEASGAVPALAALISAADVESPPENLLATAVCLVPHAPESFFVEMFVFTPWWTELTYHVAASGAWRSGSFAHQAHVNVLRVRVDCLRLATRVKRTSAPSVEREIDFGLQHPDLLMREVALDLLDGGRHDLTGSLAELLDRASHPKLVRVPEASGRESAVDLGQEFANAIVWNAASKAIARIDPDHPKAIRGLGLMVESADDPRDRVKAAATFGRHGAAAKEYVHVLLRALDSDDDRLVAEAVTALGMIGVASDEVVERLRDLTADARPGIAKRAEAALRSLEGREGDR